MRIRTAAAVVTALLALTACSSSSDDTTDAAPTPSASTQTAPAGPTAKQIAATLADATGVTDLGDEQDNTGSCSNKAAGKDPSPNDCVQLITTDTVSIYEFPSETVAAHWAKTMKAQGDWRQVGRYALAWTARDQDATSDERRDELVAALKKATAQ
ncbi:hypothetical protein ACH49_24780 [Streptomyces leeuwenhoekii]|uniref:Lipoprotein n=1 Tax=Streptomyces leeuwenhoekii TaxID=1437453 RepID=A0ABR5HSZ2_STRLW|nr:hypothetical protein [Streptomyces leeuwenhoekii]KMS71314.1 hypothetical protein ACH49_24780 [Streptomyces leeuwenhoekii]